MIDNTIIEWEEYEIANTLKMRNVGNLNESQIQFTLSRYDIMKERNMPIVSFNIPKDKVKEFMEGLKE